MNFITLTTDFGYKDFSVAITKATIYKNIKDVFLKFKVFKAKKTNQH